jgi:hypothetical protein
MRRAGVEVPRKMLRDRYTVTYPGNLAIMDVTDQGLRRPVKVARLRVETRKDVMELMDPHIIWANEAKFVLAGFERVTNAAGERVDFAQSWLCELDMRPSVDEAAASVGREHKYQF